MLRDVVGLLTCPVCGAGLDLTVPEGQGVVPDERGPVPRSVAGRTGGSALRCPAGHLFDIARHGHVSLLAGGARSGTADTPDMVRARSAFLGAGHFAPLVDSLARTAGDLLSPDAGCVLDAGAGTGHHLAAILDRAPGSVGLALDLSKYALRRAATAHPRIGAVGCDLWRPLPVRDGVADVIVNVFAPRNAAEFHRVLRADGALIVVSPTADHLSSLIEPLGLLSVDARKSQRISETLGAHFRPVTVEVCAMELDLDHVEVRTLVGMGPSARHVGGEQLAARMAGLPERVRVPAAFELSLFRPRPRP